MLRGKATGRKRASFARIKLQHNLSSINVDNAYMQAVEKLNSEKKNDGRSGYNKDERIVVNM